jgi:hypothetical protein
LDWQIPHTKTNRQLGRKELEKNNKRSESITFRLDSIILNKLRNEANQKDVSINTLASKREINELKYYPDQKLQFIILYTLIIFLIGMILYFTTITNMIQPFTIVLQNNYYYAI